MEETVLNELTEEEQNYMPAVARVKKLNATCHFCEHSGKRAGRTAIALLVACSRTMCPKIYCSRPGCRKKLDPKLGIQTMEDFAKWKKRLDLEQEEFICPHCVDADSCLGSQCCWKKKLHLITQHPIGKQIDKLQNAVHKEIDTVTGRQKTKRKRSNGRHVATRSAESSNRSKYTSNTIDESASDENLSSSTQKGSGARSNIQNEYTAATGLAQLLQRPVFPSLDSDHVSQRPSQNFEKYDMKINEECTFQPDSPDSTNSRDSIQYADGADSSSNRADFSMARSVDPNRRSVDPNQRSMDPNQRFLNPLMYGSNSSRQVSPNMFLRQLSTLSSDIPNSTSFPSQVSSSDPFSSPSSLSRSLFLTSDFPSYMTPMALHRSLLQQGMMNGWGVGPDPHSAVPPPSDFLPGGLLPSDDYQFPSPHSASAALLPFWISCHPAGSNASPLFPSSFRLSSTLPPQPSVSSQYTPGDAPLYFSHMSSG